VFSSVSAEKSNFLISQGSVPTCLRGGGYYHIGSVANFVHFPEVQKFWKPVLEQTQALQLHAKFHVNVFIFRWPKTTIFGKFWHFGGSCTDPLLPMRATFAVLEQTQGLHLCAKFHLNMFIVSASGGQKPQFWEIVTFWGLLYRSPVTDLGQICCAIADPQYTLTCQILSWSVYSVALYWRR